MKKKRITVERIVGILKQAEVGVPVRELVRKEGISEQTLYRWKKQHVSLEIDQVRQLKQLQEENQRLKRLVAELTLDKTMLQDVLAVRQILDHEQEQDLVVLKNIIHRGKDSETQGLATASLEFDMLSELERLKQALRDRSESCRAADRKWRFEHSLKALIAGTTVAYKAANALEATNVNAYDKASLIAQYEPVRFETSADYKESRVARDAAIAVQNAADNLKEKALALAAAVIVVGRDLVTADFAESRRLRALQRGSRRLSPRWPDLLASDFADIARIAMRVNWNPIFDKAASIRAAADQALIANEKYYSYMERRKNLRSLNGSDADAVNRPTREDDPNADRTPL